MENSAFDEQTGQYADTLGVAIAGSWQPSPAHSNYYKTLCAFYNLYVLNNTRNRIEKKMQRSPTVRFFDVFYEENKGKIEMPEYSNYPINNEAMNEWQESLRDNSEPERMMGLLVAQGLRHVSYGEFYGVLRSVAYQIVALSETKNMRIVLYIADSVGKSNTWVALLVWPIIRNHVIYVTNVLTRDLFEQAPAATIVAYVDDGSFSGSQIVANLNSSIIPFFKLHTFFVLAATITNNAKKAIETRVKSNNVVFPQNTIECQDLATQASTLFGETSADMFFRAMGEDPFRDGYMIMKFLHTIYFDYKLPDAMSTIQKIIALAPDLDNNSMRSLIQGCSPQYYRVDGKRPDLDDGFIDFDNDGTCPIAFYKTIDYTLNGQPVSKSTNLIACRVCGEIGQYIEANTNTILCSKACQQIAHK